MVPSLDIFRVESSGVLWCEAAATVEAAKAHIQKLAISSPGSYFILNQETGQRTPVSVESGHSPRRVAVG
jgi:hypothetical protein